MGMRRLEAALHDRSAPLQAERRRILAGDGGAAATGSEDERWIRDLVAQALTKVDPSGAPMGFFWRDVISGIRLRDGPTDGAGDVIHLTSHDAMILGYVIDVRYSTRIDDDRHEEHLTLEMDFDVGAPVEPKIIRASYVRDIPTEGMVRSYDVVPPHFLDVPASGGVDKNRRHPISHHRLTTKTTSRRHTMMRGRDDDDDDHHRRHGDVTKLVNPPSFFSIFQTIDDWYGTDDITLDGGKDYDVDAIEERTYIASVVNDLARVVPDAIEVFVGKHLEHLDDDDLDHFPSGANLKD